MVYIKRNSKHKKLNTTFSIQVEQSLRKAIYEDTYLIEFFKFIEELSEI